MGPRPTPRPGLGEAAEEGQYGPSRVSVRVPMGWEVSLAVATRKGPLVEVLWSF